MWNKWFGQNQQTDAGIVLIGTVIWGLDDKREALKKNRQK